MPEPTPQSSDSPHRCRLIRSKWMFIGAEPDTENRTESGICWCVHTQNCLGPDGQVVTPDNCTVARPCYEPL